MNYTNDTAPNTTIWRPIAFTIESLPSTKTHYIKIEKEAFYMTYRNITITALQRGTGNHKPQTSSATIEEGCSNCITEAAIHPY